MAGPSPRKAVPAPPPPPHPSTAGGGGEFSVGSRPTLGSRVCGAGVALQNPLGEFRKYKGGDSRSYGKFLHIFGPRCRGTLLLRKSWKFKLEGNQAQIVKGACLKLCRGGSTLKGKRRYLGPYLLGLQPLCLFLSSLSSLVLEVLALTSLLTGGQWKP